MPTRLCKPLWRVLRGFAFVALDFPTRGRPARSWGKSELVDAFPALAVSLHQCRAAAWSCGSAARDKKKPSGEAGLYAGQKVCRESSSLHRSVNPEVGDLKEKGSKFSVYFGFGFQLFYVLFKVEAFAEFLKEVRERLRVFLGCLGKAVLRFALSKNSCARHRAKASSRVSVFRGPPRIPVPSFSASCWVSRKARRSARKAAFSVSLSSWLFRSSIALPARLVRVLTRVFISSVPFRAGALRFFLLEEPASARTFITLK